MYFQDPEDSPISGIITSPTTMLQVGSQIFIGAFRHLIVMTGASTSRPLVRFGPTQAGALEIAHMTSLDQWETINKVCVAGPPVSINEVTCCTVYPCFGQVRINQIKALV